jgi:hypothetical protein
MRWLLLLVACAAPVRVEKTQRAPLTFIEDDYARAKAEAQKNARPIFVETWAPW